MNTMIDSLETPSVACKDVNDKKQTKKDCYMDEFSDLLQQYILKMIDVRADKNGSYKAIATLLGQGEDSWTLIRQDLIRELQTQHSLYLELLGTEERLVQLINNSLYVKNDPITSYDKWMIILNMDMSFLVGIILSWFPCQCCKIGLSFCSGV